MVWSSFNRMKSDVLDMPDDLNSSQQVASAPLIPRRQKIHTSEDLLGNLLLAILEQKELKPKAKSVLILNEALPRYTNSGTFMCRTLQAAILVERAMWQVSTERSATKPNNFTFPDKARFANCANVFCDGAIRAQMWGRKKPHRQQHSPRP